jgi:hypothetical protein
VVCLHVHYANKARRLQMSAKLRAWLARQVDMLMSLVPPSAKLAAQGVSLMSKNLQLAHCAKLGLSQMKVVRQSVIFALMVLLLPLRANSSVSRTLPTLEK